MVRTVALWIALFTSSDVCGQLLVEHYPATGPKIAIRRAATVPAALAGQSSLQFEMLDLCFDGGSYGAFFKRENGAKLILFFPNPTYWSAKAKRESKQPVAIQGKELVEIEPDSPLQSRLLQLLANDIVDGNRDRESTLTLIRIRDCLLKRTPLDEIIESYDPTTWELRDSQAFIADEDPFDNAIDDSEGDDSEGDDSEGDDSEGDDSEGDDSVGDDQVPGAHQPTIDEMLLFFPTKFPSGDWSPTNLRYQDVYFDAQDGTRLHGWYCPCDSPRATILIAHGNVDHIIPYQSGQALFREANDPKTFVTIEGRGHNDWLTSDYLRKLDEFIDSLSDSL